MSAKNPLQHLADFGQSVWNDNLSRDLITSGELQRLIDNDGIVGITSNPTIFDAAISDSDDYDEQMRELVAAGRSAGEIQDALMVKDIQDACDILIPVYEASGGQDGMVSLEVSPLLAHDTEGTISEARRLNALVNRPNVMIKIPGTPEGIPAIEQTLFEGININITLLFSLDAYRSVMEAYLRAMERRVAEGKPVEDIVSVASFFVSRVDSEVDARLDAIIDESDGESERATTARALKGTIAIANARLAYQEFKGVFQSTRFSDLAGRGVRIQRPLWASTSTKDPDYPDTLYVDELIGPNTVQTLAPASIEAFRDHGTVSLTVEKHVDVADDAIREMESLGISYDDVIDVLVSEGVEKFAASFESLTASIDDETSRIAGELHTARLEEIGSLATDVETALAELDADGVVTALQRGTGSFWTSDPSTATEIGALLGWLHTVPEMQSAATAGVFSTLASGVRNRGYARIVLLGMGGSSLAPEVMVSTLDRQSNAPSLTVLDSTHPDAIARLQSEIDGQRTLFVVSSKSGTTIETASLFNYFLTRQGEMADDFIIITDPGTPLEAHARQIGAWKIFTNRPDIGGRFSALSFFGLVPAAAAGVNVDDLLASAAAVLPVVDAHHPGVFLGATLATAAHHGRNKLTLVSSDHWAPFGDWLEQLLAESTGKNGGGIVPVVREPNRPLDDYGDDRLFVVIDDGDPTLAEFASTLRSAGHPVVTAPADLGRLFMIWEVATAVAGQRLQINPFDQPNVQEAKDQTNQVLSNGGVPDIPVSNAESAMSAIRKQAGDGTYIAIQAFVDPTEEMRAALAKLQSSIAAATRRPVTLGIGPRFLHSTGQLHKGGPDQGVFLQIVQDATKDIEVPGKDWGFRALISAQADGDFLALSDRDLSITRLSISSADDVRSMAQAAQQSALAAD